MFFLFLIGKNRTLADSLTYVQKALVGIRKIGDVYLESHALLALGKVQYAMGQHDKVHLFLLFCLILWEREKANAQKKRKEKKKLMV